MPTKACDIAVIGAGPAGMMAAIRAGQLGWSVVLLERNSSLGKKLLLTGKGRCNITNIAPIDTFIIKFGKQGNFYRQAFNLFFNQDLIGFFEAKALRLKIERQGRVFPDTDQASSVVNGLEDYLKENNVQIVYNKRVVDIKKNACFFKLILQDKDTIEAKKIILATGGISYKDTGSTGDGFKIAGKFGHKIQPLFPGLVPLKTNEACVKELQGLALKNVVVTFKYDRKKIVSEVGEIMFTHFGVSGPLILDLSGRITAILKDHKEIHLLIDLKPGLTEEQLEGRLLSEFKIKGKIMLKNIMKDLMPHSLIPVFINMAGLNGEKTGNQITGEERRVMMEYFKHFPLTINGSLNIEEAMVTGGGVSTDEIDPRTMESKIVPGLYFAGEMIDGFASSGGYSLQQAFSTGYMAGESAGKNVTTNRSLERTNQHKFKK